MPAPTSCASACSLGAPPPRPLRACAPARALARRVKRSSHNYVLNGIAYHPESHRLYVTGKQWDHMYQIRVRPGRREDQTPSFVEGNCHLGRADGRRAG